MTKGSSAERCGFRSRVALWAVLSCASEALAQPAAADAGAVPSGPKNPTRLIQTPDGVSVLTNKPGDWNGARIDAGVPRRVRPAPSAEVDAAAGVAPKASTPSPAPPASAERAPVAATESYGALKWLGSALALVAALIVAVFLAKARR